MTHAGLSTALLGSAVFLFAGCNAGGPRLDPARSAEMASSAVSAATTPGPELRSEDAVKRPDRRLATPDADERAIRAALADSSRRAADRERDQARQSAAVLTFFGVRPGMVVLDLYSGGGYYTEILSRLVGSDGHVVAHNNSAYRRMLGAELSERYAPGRLANVEQLIAENNALDLPEQRFDLVLMIDVYHDVYYVNEAQGWQKIDAPKLLAEVFASMKPGAVLGVVDHAASPGSPAGTGGTLHRIDPALLKRDMAAAGFILDGESNVLRNPEDDRSKSVFDPSVRGRTDQVVLRFRKPA